jgi:arylformamidase
MSEQWSALEREYSPSSMVADLDMLIADYRAQSARARDRIAPETFAYGKDPDELLDVFGAGHDWPVHIFVHGGYWQDLSKDDSSFPAPGFVSAGVAYVAVDYGLAPARSLDQIVEQVRSAIGWIHLHGRELRLDCSRMVVSGSSAGAHLAAMAALTDWAGRGLPADLISGLVLMSGIYDLEPLVETYINDAVGLDAEAARRNSPIRLIGKTTTSPIPTVVTWGEFETGTFKQQSKGFAAAWRKAGHPVSLLEARARNHFDIVQELSDETTPLGNLISAHGRKLTWT